MSSPLNPSSNNAAAPQENVSQERKYFDSGDYALSKAGKTTTPVGSQHPQPENIPHSNPAAPNAGSPPVKESSLVHESEIPEGTAPQP
ncbi:hypothetical protein BGX27_003389 [Mortierella sp. AM989]|nr:hypothetical protein BGX27_003389 [Mortierella sp. AM989]